ncbi:MAG: endonuclease III domain-containing protein [Candidatus Thorarchaeota archaeon]
MKSEDKITIVCDLLLKNYGDTVVRSKRPTIEVLVRGILSQNTNDINMDRAYENLTAKYRSWEDVLHAPEDELGHVIRTSGFFRIKAKRIKATLSEIRKRVGRLDLELLRNMETNAAMEWLTSLHGIGPKTAAIVLLFSFGKPTLPVDTHVWRVTRRLGLIPEKVSRVKAQKLLQELVPKPCLFSINHNLVKHGREVCKAINPRCEECSLRAHCNYYKSLH